MLDIWSPQIANNPLAFVRYVYPWGKEGTPLVTMKEPRRWQCEYLEEMGDYLVNAQSVLDRTKLPPPMFKAATVSGRGPGKSALVGMISHWFRSVRLGGTCIVTANTETQLKSKTMPEIAKWANLAINSHWFETSALSVRPAPWFAELLKKKRGMGGLEIDDKYYYTMAQLWSEENPDAFAGAHNWSGEMYIFDEASGIPENIWAVTQGVFTEPIIDRYWLVFSNGRRNTGAFFECFHKNRDDWRRRQIDARTVEGVDPSTYQSIIDKYGPDHDNSRIEVYGQFPNLGDRQFIPMDVIEKAVSGEAVVDMGAPLLMGVDVARFGEDRSVIAFRRGRDARSIPWQVYRGLDTFELASKVAEAADKYGPDAIFVDGNGVGGGVVDALKHMGYKVIEVQAGGSPENKQAYRAKREEMWDRLREWLAAGGRLPMGDPDLVDDLKGPEYDYHPVQGYLQLERKDDMKKRGLASPDLVEALAQTFARPVARVDAKFSRAARARRREKQAADDYPYFG